MGQDFISILLAGGFSPAAGAIVAGSVDRSRQDPAAFAGLSGPGISKEAVVDGQDYGDFPLVSREVLDVLQEGVGAPEVYREYVGRYLAMWPGRYQRLVSALGSGDEEALMDAVLSVKTSAGMLGALRLARLVLDMEDAVRERIGGVRARLDELELCGRLTMEQLRHELGQDPFPRNRKDGQ